jgi:hypothetical protein
MVLVQVPITSYTDGRLTASIPCNLQGRYNVKFLSYMLHWTTNPNLLIRVNSQDLFGNFVGGQLLVGSNSSNYSVFHSNGLEFVCDKINGSIDIELTDLNGATPADLLYGIFYFDFEKIKENL